ncbi:MAG TPA: amino acid permease [Gemmatimonadaceae bacterium]|jgi:APA family basic amino acid/polyamine antiporter|nr:amino acid permease [Gemmatimonadaceae bacterium]
MALGSTKSIAMLQAEAADEGSHSLKRVLTVYNLTFLGIGAIIGAGIFVLTGHAAAENAGNAVVLSFGLAFFGCLFAGLCYAEFASVVPIAGSAYTYAYATLGEFMAFFIGWNLVLEYMFGAATVGVGWAGYFSDFMAKMGIVLPKAFSQAPVAWSESLHRLVAVPGGIINLPAFLLVMLMTVVLVIGIKESARFNNFVVFIKMAIVLLVIGVGFFFVNAANWHPFIAPSSGTFGKFGLSGVVRGAAVVFFAYIGFDAVSTAAQEAKNPQRDLPIAMLGSLVICTVLYVLMSLVLTGLAPYNQLDVPHPVAYALSHIPQLGWLEIFVDIGAIAGLASVVLVMLLGQSRVFFSMSRDGLLPPALSRVHPKFRTPYVTTILSGTVAAVIAAIFPIDILGELVSIGTLCAFTIVCAGVIVLRIKRPDLHRPFKTPFVPYVPLLGIGSCLGLMAFLPRATWIRLIVWMLVGFVVYFAYGRYHSKLATEREPSLAPAD